MGLAEVGGDGFDEHHEQSRTNIYNTRNAIKINAIKNVGEGGEIFRAASVRHHSV